MKLYPIVLVSVFEHWTIYHQFKNTDELEKWLEERKLTLISMYQCDDVLVCTAVNNINKVEKLL